MKNFTRVSLFVAIAVLVTANVATAGYISSFAVRNSHDASHYSIETNLQVGDYFYNDRTHTTFTSLTAGLLGADHVATASDDSSEANFELDITVGPVDGTLYYVHRPAPWSVLPDWVAAGGWTLSSQDGETGEPNWEALDMYELAVAAGSTTTVYEHPGWSYHVVGVAIPEPGSITLLVMGLLGLATRRSPRQPK